MVAQRLGVRVVFVGGVLKLRNQPPDQRHLLFRDSQPLLGLAQGLFLVGVGYRLAALLGKLAAV